MTKNLQGNLPVSVDHVTYLKKWRKKMTNSENKCFSHNGTFIKSNPFGYNNGFSLKIGELVYFKLNHELAKLPKKAEEGSSCYDLYSVEEKTLQPKEFYAFSTGLSWQPNNKNVEMQIRPRSGLAAKHGITVLNSPGTVDGSYRGIIKVLLINHGQRPYTVAAGERIAQAFLGEYSSNYVFEVIERLEESTRHGGFGSTGKI